MAHEITNNEMAWRSEKPWHNAGVQVKKDASIDEMRKAAKMTWTADPIAFEKTATMKEKTFEALQKYRYIMRSDNGDVFQVASDKYQPVQPAHIVEFFKEYCEAGHAQLDTIGSLKGGRTIWAQAKLNVKNHAVGGDKKDTVEGRILIATSFTGFIPTIVKPTNIYVVCWNTLSAAVGTKSKKEFRVRHTTKWDDRIKKEAQEVMGISIEQVQQANSVADQLSKVSIDEKGRLDFVYRLLNNGESLVDQIVADQSAGGGISVDALVAATESKQEKDPLKRLGKTIIESILNSPGHDLKSRKDTLWGAVNGVTYFVDHMQARNADARMTSAWFGKGDNLKLDAVSTAMQMAGLKAA